MLPKDPSKLEAYKQRQRETHSGANNPNFGKHRSEETKRRISEGEKGKVVSLETREKISKAGIGRVVPLERRERIRAKLKGVPRPPEVVEKMRAGFQEYLKLHPEYRIEISKRMTGKKMSPESIRKGSEKRTGRKVSEETKRKLREINRKEKHPQWLGGISFEPYCVLFDERFKERVRVFFGYQCVECGTPQIKRKLHIHHVNFDKMSCCNDTIPLFVPLCRSCHGKSNFRRPYWEQSFTDIINSYYGGKCYFTDKEMEAYCES